MNEPKKCIFCGRGIIAYKKWDVKYRDSHYSCWKRKQNEIACENMLEQYKADISNNLLKMGIVEIKREGCENEEV